MKRPAIEYAFAAACFGVVAFVIAAAMAMSGRG